MTNNNQSSTFKTRETVILFAVEIILKIFKNAQFRFEPQMVLDIKKNIKKRWLSSVPS